ncbi:hypothetical protein FJZ19_01825 [Candidatus Pacearchaeota archaeon]|nr:hypothetical protein [Candidatus Pacearchaeota archaeon]
MEETIEERKIKAKNFLKGKISWIYYLILGVIIAINVYIRTLPMRIINGHPGLWDITTNNWTLGPDLDPFLFFRYAKYIVEQGSLMINDMMRYVPFGYVTAGETRLLPYMIAWLHTPVKWFNSQATIEYTAVIFPVVMSVFTAVFFFLLVRKIFEGKGKNTSNIIALISTALMIILPSLLSRTIAGIPEKESAGFAFFFATFYFFLCAWKAKKTYSMIINSIFAGLATALMGLIWGAWVFIFIILSVSVFLVFILGKTGKRELVIYSLWLISMMIFTLPFTLRITLQSLVTSSSTSMAFALWLVLIVDFIIFKTKLKDTGFINKIKEKIKLPEQIISIISAFIIIIIIASIKFGIGFVPGVVGDIITHLTVPYEDRISFTVAENRQPYFGEWAREFGPVVYGIPLFFWLFFIGSIFLFYETVGNLKRNEKWLLTVAYTIFLFCLIFSRYSSSSVFDGASFTSKFVYFGGIILFGIVFLYVYYKYKKENQNELLKSIDFNHILIFILFFLTIIAARSAIRLIMVLAPVAAIIIGYFIVDNFLRARKAEDEIIKVLAWVVAIVVVIASIYTMYYDYQVTKNSAMIYIPSIYSNQWQKAMEWVRNNTPKDAVFSHWWDYGYWVQTMGERATVLDGGNAIAYWDHLMGRHVLTGKTEREALEFMYTHNSTYFLIDSTEIGKYGAYSSIGSDENYDRYSWIGTFTIDETQTQETKNETIYLYRGGVATDADIIWNDNSTKIIMPAQKAGIGGILLPIANINGSVAVHQPTALFVYNNRYIKIPMRYVFYNNKSYDFQTGLPSGIFIMPQVTNTGISNIGAGLYLSEKNLNALWVRLYLLGEGEYFHLVHNEPDLRIQNLREQGIGIGDFALYNNDILGPIKIWNISFPQDMQANPDYLSYTYSNQNLFYAGKPF